MKNGIIFSGGGTKIAGHAGYAAALEDAGMKYKFVGGVSAGAIIAPFVAAGLMREKAKLFKYLKPEMFWKHAPVNARGKLTMYAYWNILRGKPYLGDMSNLEKTLKRHFPRSLYQKLLDETIYCWSESCDINAGDVVFQSTFPAICDGLKQYSAYQHFIKAIIASSSIPVFSKLVDRKNSRHADGGLRNHLPIKGLERYIARMDRLFVVYSRPERISEVLDKMPKPKTLMEILQRTIDIMGWEISKNDQQQIRDLCSAYGVKLVELYHPAGVTKGVYDTDPDRIRNLFNDCYVKGLRAAKKHCPQV